MCEIDEIKIKIQKYLKDSNILKEKFEAIKSVNIELQYNAEKLQKDLDEKQKILESLTQGKENLNAILGSKINVNKEGLGYVPKIKKKYDVITMNFVPQQKTEINPLIKMNCLLPENIDKNLVTVHSEKEKEKEKIEENKIIQVKSKKKLKTIKLNLKPIQNKSQKNKIISKGRPSIASVSTQNKMNQHITVQASTQLKNSIRTGQRTVKNESTQYDRTYNRSTPIEQNI